MATAGERRIVGVDLQTKVASMKTSLDAINTVTAAWVVNDEDASLPAASAIKEQLLAFDALAKPGINMTDALAAIRAV